VEVITVIGHQDSTDQDQGDTHVIEPIDVAKIDPNAHVPVTRQSKADRDWERSERKRVRDEMEEKRHHDKHIERQIEDNMKKDEQQLNLELLDPGDVTLDGK
jgi:hypothetical protein